MTGQITHLCLLRILVKQLPPVFFLSQSAQVLIHVHECRCLDNVNVRHGVYASEYIWQTSL